MSVNLIKQAFNSLAAKDTLIVVIVIVKNSSMKKVEKVFLISTFHYFIILFQMALSVIFLLKYLPIKFLN